MEQTNTLLIRKRDGVVKDTLSDFGMATGDIPWPAAVTVKDLGEEDCPGESGKRVFFPEELPVEAYDLDVEFKYVGNLGECYSAFCKFRDYLLGLDGGGTELEIYSPWHGIGRRQVWLKSIGEPKFRRDNKEEYLGMTVAFNVADPLTDITLAKS